MAKGLTWSYPPACMPNGLEAAPEGAKRRYEAHFVSKLTDADGENGETESWLDFASDCEFLSKSHHTILTEKCREVGAMLGTMINMPTSFILKSSDL